MSSIEQTNSSQIEYPSFVNVRTNRQIEIRSESLSIARNIFQEQQNNQQQQFQQGQHSNFRHPLMIFEPIVQVKYIFSFNIFFFFFSSTINFFFF